jgi:hypothetical protein
MKTKSVTYSVATCSGVFFLLTGCMSTSDGSRAPFMRLMEAELHTYSARHGGRYPDGAYEWEALAKLYPDYSATGVELAGLSGNIQQVTNALQKGLSISNFTSWSYATGLRSCDNPQLAILWESRSGFTEIGNSAPRGERPVLLLNGEITNIVAANWDSFLKRQEQLRKGVTH